MLELRGDELRVTELAEPFDISLAGASKHIRVLEDAGLIRRTVVGREHFLSLDARPLKPAAEWIDVTAFWEGRLDALDRHLREGRRRCTRQTGALVVERVLRFRVVISTA